MISAASLICEREDEGVRWGRRERTRERGREVKERGKGGVDIWRGRESRLATGSVSTWGIISLEQGSSTSPC